MDHVINALVIPVSDDPVYRHIMAKLIVNLVAALGYMITFLLCTYSVGRLADVSPWLAVVSGL